MKMFVLLFFIFFSYAEVSLAQKIQFTENMLKETQKAIDSTIDLAFSKEDDESDLSPTLSGLKQSFFEIFDTLFISGYMEPAYYDQIIEDYDKLSFTVNSDWNESKHKEELKLYIQSFFTPKLKYIKEHPRQCVSYLGVSNYGQCCQGLIKERHPLFNLSGKSCTKPGNSCSQNAQCCSGSCVDGTCDEIMTCFEEIKTNAVCSDDNPICKERENGVSCVLFEGSPILKGTGSFCEKNSECRSQQCANSKCVEVKKCLKCSKNGEIPKNDKPCCPGFYKGQSGKCIQDWPRFIPSVKLNIKNIFNHIAGIFFPKAYASDDDKCTYPCNNLSHLPYDQRKQIESIQESCVKNPSSDKSLESCLKDAADLERSFYNIHKTNKTITEPTQGAKGKKSYIDEYNIPYVTSLGQSDVKSCQFNSLKDDIVSANPLERNAELILSSFEYVYSGSGGDFFNETPGGKDVFNRLKDIAQILRRNRSRMLNKYQENDKRMSCLCVAVSGGISKFPDKANFYESFCKTDPSIQSEIASLNILGDGGSEISSQSSNAEQSDYLENTTQGATGLSHERFLVAWLKAKASIQLERYSENEKVEKELSDILAYLNTYPWDKNYSEKLKPLYNFALTWTDQTFTILMTLFCPTCAMFMQIEKGGSWKSANSFESKNVLNFHPALLTTFKLDPRLAPSIYDERTKLNEKNGKVRGEFWNKAHTYRYIGYNRSYSYNYSSQCDLDAPTTLCLKNAFEAPDSLKASSDYPTDKYYFIDLKKPLFMTHNEIKYDRSFVDSINAKTAKIVNLLKTTYPQWEKGDLKPSGKKYLDPRNPKQGYDPQKYWSYYAKRTGRGVSYEHRDPFLEYKYKPGENKASFGAALKKLNKLSDEHVPVFMEMLPNYDIKKLDPKDQFIAGFKKYATCHKLLDCATTSEDKAGLTEEDVGFQMFLENGITHEIDEAELNEFANYTYQLHYLWPSTTEKNNLSYPTPGLIPYFEGLYYYTKLLGSLQLNKGNDSILLWEAYEDDLLKRASDYGIPAASLGFDQSKNIKLSGKFMRAFKKLDLKGGASVNDYKTTLDNIVKSNEYSPAEVGLFKSAINRAIRGANDKKAFEHFQNTYGKTKEGEAVLKASKERLDTLGSPLGKSQPLLASLKASDLNLNKETSKPSNDTKKEESSYKAPNFNFSSPSYSSSSSSGTSSASTAHGLSDKELDKILDSASSDKTLYDESPLDSLFIKVSKVYKRNLDRLLVKRIDDKKIEETKVDKKELDKKKQDLKKLLEKSPN